LAVGVAGGEVGPVVGHRGEPGVVGGVDLAEDPFPKWGPVTGGAAATGGGPDDDLARGVVPDGAVSVDRLGRRETGVDQGADDVVDVGPIDLFTNALHFAPTGRVRAGERRMADGDGDWQLAVFHVETDEDVHAEYWEKHPPAEEAVCCVRGAIRLYLRATEPDADNELVTLRSGQAAIVPRDRWHRLEVDEPTDLMAVTLRHGSEIERRSMT
jgi:quercetin dioxygenase-like cupin family protein